MAVPEDDDCDQNRNCERDEFPGNGCPRRPVILAAALADMFRARQLQIGQLLDLNRGLGLGNGFGRRRSDLDCRGRMFRHRQAFGLPDLLRIDLRLAQASKISVDGFVRVEAEMFGIGTNESAIEDSPGKLIEVFVFDSLEHARSNLGDVGNVIEREILALACLAELVPEFAQRFPGSCLRTMLPANHDRACCRDPARTNSRMGR